MVGQREQTYPLPKKFTFLNLGIISDMKFYFTFSLVHPRQIEPEIAL